MATSGSGLVLSVLGAVVLFGAASWMFSPRGDLAGSKAPEVAAVETQAPAPAPDTAPQAPANAQHRDGTVASITTVTEAPMPDAAAKDIPPETETADQPAESLDGLAALIEQEVTDAGKAEARPTNEGGRVYGAENRDSRLVLKAKAPVWIRIEDGKGNVVITQTLMTGDSYRVPNREGLVIIARDGGLLGVEIDGASKGTLGQPGEILVGRALDISKLSQKG
jgi:cytoskeleton protein RodZ